MCIPDVYNIYAMIVFIFVLRVLMRFNRNDNDDGWTVVRKSSKQDKKRKKKKL